MGGEGACSAGEKGRLARTDRHAGSEVPVQQPAVPAQPEQQPMKRPLANADTLDESDRDIWILGDSTPHWVGVRA